MLRECEASTESKDPTLFRKPAVRMEVGILGLELPPPAGNDFPSRSDFFLVQKPSGGNRTEI